MEENIKINNEQPNLSSNSIKGLKNKNKNYLSQILLNSNRSKIKPTTKQYKLNSNKNINSPEFPQIRSSYQPSSIYNNNDYNNKESDFSRNNLSSNISNSNKYQLKRLLFNSISFDNYQKVIMKNKFSNNSKKDMLPPIIQEENKESCKNVDSFINEINSSVSSKKNEKLSKKKYSFCLKTLCEINTNKRYDLTKIKEKNKQNLYKISKNKILREIILNEYNGNDINYEDQKLLGDFKYYNKWIKKKLLELKREIPSEENVHRTFEKEYKNSKYNKPLLTFNSLSISFNCKGKYHLFHIPFEFLPLFYYKNMSYLKYILTCIIKFYNDFEDINIDFDEIIYILSCCKQFEIIEEEITETIDTKIIDESTKNINPETNFISLNTKIDKKQSTKKLTNRIKEIKGVAASPEIVAFTPKEVIQKKNSLRLINKKITKLINNNINNQENLVAQQIKKSKKIVKIEEKNLYKCIYNKILFKWITPKYNYDITVKAPEAIFHIGKTVLKVYVDIEFIFYLLENKFENWDFYISQYIFSYKECHKKMGKIISVKRMEQLFLNKNNSLPILHNSFSSDNIKEKKLSNLNTEKIYQISDKSKKYEFIYTDESNINYIKIFHSFFISARCKTFINNKFIFDFNFSHMRILNKILRIQRLTFFLKKLIWVDRQNLSLKFRYDELSSLSNDQYKVLEKHDPNLTTAQECIRMKERDRDVINICISFPSLETIKYNNKNYENCFESDYDDIILAGVPLDILDEICKNDFNEWPSILMENK